MCSAHDHSEIDTLIADLLAALEKGDKLEVFRASICYGRDWLFIYGPSIFACFLLSWEQISVIQAVVQPIKKLKV